MKFRVVGDNIQIYSQYNRDFVSKVSAIPGRVFYPETKVWSVPITSLSEVQVAFPKIPNIVIEQAKKKLGFEPTELKYAQINGKPYDYQKIGASFLMKRQKCILADEMGLGKTIQALMACEELYLAGEIEHTIIFCPSTIKFTIWEREINKWLPERDVVVIDGTRAKRKKLWEKKAHFYVVNYELVRNACDYPIIKTIVDNNACVIVADECTRFKSWQTKTSKAIKSLNAPYKFCLSGAPVENTPAELYSINQFLDNNILGNWRNFDLRYIVRDIWGGIAGYKNLDDLRRRILFIMLRRKKVDVLDLPPVIKQTRLISLTPTESREYKMLTKPVFDLLTFKKFKISVVLGNLTLCRMYLDHPDLLRHSESPTAKRMVENMKAKTSSKFEEFKALLPELEGHKVVVFSQFRKMIAILHELLGEKSIEFVGGMSPKDKELVIDTFNSELGAQFFLSTETGAYGVNLPIADVIINYDLPWNPAKLQQRIDRLHRIGQRNTVNVINLLVEDEDKIEKKVKKVLGRKEEWAKQILEGEEND